MNRVCIALLFFLLIPATALADTITMVLGFNAGGGDNFIFLDQGNGFLINIFGGTPVSFFGGDGFAPGSTIGGGTDVFFDGGTDVIHGVGNDLTFLATGSLFLSPFTLPTNDKNFSVNVTLSFSVPVMLPDGQTITISGSAPGRLNLSFNSDVGLYETEGVVATTAPEPATLLLISSGVGGLAFLARRKKG